MNTKLTIGEEIEYQGTVCIVVAAKKDFKTGSISYRLSNGKLVSESDLLIAEEQEPPITITGADPDKGADEDKDLEDDEDKDLDLGPQLGTVPFRRNGKK